jgi:hypothetical protein
MYCSEVKMLIYFLDHIMKIPVPKQLRPSLLLHLLQPLTVSSFQNLHFIPHILVMGMNICPPQSMYNATADRCCMTIADTPGSNGSYCNIPAQLPGGGTKCPPTHPYDQARMMCCGPNPITGK